MILLIEDNRPFTQVLRLLLAPTKVIVAHDMTTALALVNQVGENDTILVDLKLPDSAPLDTLCRIADWKIRDPSPRVIVITGVDDDHIVRAARCSAADGVALKRNPVIFFETLRDFDLIQRRETKACADSSTVEQIEHEVRGLVDGD